MNLSTQYNSAAPYPHVWDIFIGGVCVWSQVTMFAPDAIKQLVEDFRVDRIDNNARPA